MRHRNAIIYDSVLVFLSLCILISAAVIYIICKRSKTVVRADQTETLSNGDAISVTKISATSYSLMEIDAATDGFNRRRIVGSGRLGTVYVAATPKGDINLAVKRIHPRLVLSNAGFGFSSVLKWLSLADHPNVVPIIGFSEAPGERIILTELDGMLSLEFYLHQNPDGAKLLDWTRRVKIAAGAAKGLEYLHEVMTPPVIHGCVKPSNILTDVKFCAKICDYGLHFLAPYGGKRGLEGYVDEEYWIDRRGPSKESDVFGFGVVLLELLSGRRSVIRDDDSSNNGSNNSYIRKNEMVKWALPLIKEMRYSEFLDPRIEIPGDVKQLVRLARVALACVGNTRKNRPSMVQVAAILSNLEMYMS